MSEELSHEDIVRKFVRPGDTLTHTSCGCGIQEHIYSGKDGLWLCGTPTRDTMRIDKLEGSAKSNWTNDISPKNVTHINRIEVEAVPFAADFDDRH